MTMNKNSELGSDTASALPTLSFWQALGFWFKLGWISFGGPAGQIALMHSELVERRRWLSEKRFLHALNYCMLLPGPEAQQLATYIGWLMHGRRGGLVAGALFVLPSLLILIILSWAYLAFAGHAWLAALFYGIKPAVCAIVLQAAQRLGLRVIRSGISAAIALAAWIAVAWLALPFPLVVASAALLAWGWGKLRPLDFVSTSHSAKQSVANGEALIADDTALAASQRFSWLKTGWLMALFIAAWSLPLLSLYGLFGWHHAYTRMAWFFSKAALLTFGGAYAVLPYVYQGAVLHYQWLLASQMMDGLALGESTPGPLIMVVVFVGFVGAWQAQIWPEAPWLAGIVGACIVCWFTFLPSFMFILVGAPLVEATQHLPSLSTALAGVTAAAVGVMLNLACFFAWHTIWPQALWFKPDYLALSLAGFAIFALLRLRWSVLQVLAACAGLGGILRWVIASF